MRRVARRGSARRAQQAQRAGAELRTAARVYAAALDEFMTSAAGGNLRVLDFWRAERRLTNAALRFARTDAR